MNEIAFTQQIKAMSDRLENLYQGIHISSSQPSALLPSALKELGIAAEQLQLAAGILHQQNQKLSLINQATVADRQRYQELLEFIPDACLITDASGRIQEANQAASKLLNLPYSSLVGRLLPAFITFAGQQQLQNQLQQLQLRGKQQYKVRLQPYRGTALDVDVLIEASQQNANQSVSLRWLLRYPRSLESNAELDYPIQIYHKGETVPLDPQVVWQVRSGLVKLTTFSTSGQRVLIGLAGASAPFGSTLTALPLYEATALSDTQLWCIPLTKFTTSPELKQRLLPQITQRLKQAELLLAISGQPRVVDRLHSLLQLLKQEIGQPVADGTRLRVRLTHQDLATACCTTRVSVTRLLNKLQEQNKLSVDSQYHLVLKGVHFS